MNWQTILKLAMVLHMTSFITGLAFVKSVQDGFLNSSPKSKRTIVDCYANKGEAFLTRIVTGDETWVHHFAPESKRQSMEWKHPGSPVKKKFKSQPSARKVMLTIFWDSQGVILEHYLERDTTLDSVGYNEMLSTELKPAIRTKCRGLCRQVFCCCMTTRVHILPSTLFKLL